MSKSTITTIALSLFLLAVLPGCLTISVQGFVPHSERAIQTPGNDIPLAGTFWKLHRERNRIGTNDCSNKCGRYAQALRAKGYNADVVVISMPREQNLHAVVQLDDGRCLDPTFGKVAGDVSAFGEVKFVLAGNPSSWGPEFN